MPNTIVLINTRYSPCLPWKNSIMKRAMVVSAVINAKRIIVGIVRNPRT